MEFIWKCLKYSFCVLPRNSEKAGVDLGHFYDRKIFIPRSKSRNVAVAMQLPEQISYRSFGGLQYNTRLRSWSATSRAGITHARK